MIDSKSYKPERKYRSVRIVFYDEARFGRINPISKCWCPPGVRPIVPSLQVREYVYLYGAVSPIDGDSFFITTPKCDTECTEIFLTELSKRYPDDLILAIGDHALWHKSKAPNVPENIRFAFIPPRTPEMNPIEQIWKEMRKEGGFKNVLIPTLKKVEEKLIEAVKKLSNETVMSITKRDWIL